MAFHVPKEYRVTKGKMGSDDTYGNNGAFIIYLGQFLSAVVIASDGEGWEHVSVHIMDHGQVRTPLWEEMCEIKDQFWDPEDCVVQFHPPKENYINNHPNTLHLWRQVDKEFPQPPSELVGIKT